MKTFLFFCIATSFGAGLLYMDLAVYEHPNLHLVSSYLLAVYGGWMGGEIFDYIVKGRGKQVNSDARCKNND